MISIQIITKYDVRGNKTEDIQINIRYEIKSILFRIFLGFVVVLMRHATSITIEHSYQLSHDLFRIGFASC